MEIITNELDTDLVDATNRKPGPDEDVRFFKRLSLSEALQVQQVRLLRKMLEELGSIHFEVRDNTRDLF